MDNSLKTNSSDLSDPIDQKRSVIELKDTAVKLMILTGVFQILCGAIIGLLGYLPRIIEFDVLYWPPLLLFTMERMYFWLGIGIFIASISMGQILVALFYRKYLFSAKLERIVKAFGIFELFFFPIGTIFGIKQIGLINSANTQKLELLQQEEPLILRKTLSKNIGQILVYTSLFDFGLLWAFWLLTIYLSTVMLDITYPYLTMGLLYQLRYGMIGFAIILGIQIGFGIMYTNNENLPKSKVLLYFFGIIQLVFFPIGTYSGVLILRNLRYDRKFKLK